MRKNRIVLLFVVILLLTHAGSKIGAATDCLAEYNQNMGWAEQFWDECMRNNTSGAQGVNACQAAWWAAYYDANVEYLACKVLN